MNVITRWYFFGIGTIEIILIFPHRHVWRSRVMVVVVDFCGEFFKNPWWGFWWHGMDDHVHFIPCNLAMTHRLCFFPEILDLPSHQANDFAHNFPAEICWGLPRYLYATMTTGNMATSEVHGSSQERLCGTGCLATWRIDRWNPRDLLGCCFITPFLGYT